MQGHEEGAIGRPDRTAGFAGLFVDLSGTEYQRFNLLDINNGSVIGMGCVDDMVVFFVPAGTIVRVKIIGDLRGGVVVNAKCTFIDDFSRSFGHGPGESAANGPPDAEEFFKDAVCHLGRLFSQVCFIGVSKSNAEMFRSVGTLLLSLNGYQEILGFYPASQGDGIV